MWQFFNKIEYWLNTSWPFPNQSRKLVFFFKILFIDSWETHTEKGRDTGRGRTRLLTGSPNGTGSQVSRIRPWADVIQSPRGDSYCFNLAFFFFLRFSLFIHERHTQRKAVTQGSIPQPWDHDLSWNQESDA